MFRITAVDFEAEVVLGVRSSDDDFDDDDDEGPTTAVNADTDEDDDDADNDNKKMQILVNKVTVLTVVQPAVIVVSSSCKPKGLLLFESSREVLV